MKYQLIKFFAATTLAIAGILPASATTVLHRSGQHLSMTSRHEVEMHDASFGNDKVVRPLRDGELIWGFGSSDSNALPGRTPPPRQGGSRFPESKTS